MMLQITVDSLNADLSTQVRELDSIVCVDEASELPKKLKELGELLERYLYAN